MKAVKKTVTVEIEADAYVAIKGGDHGFSVAFNGEGRLLYAGLVRVMACMVGDSDASVDDFLADVKTDVEALIKLDKETAVVQ